jgi:hypothetical protein
MRIRIAGILCALTVCALINRQVQANLIVGTTTATVGLPSAYEINTSNMQVAPLWIYSTATNNGAKVNGIAADDTNGFLHTANAARYNRWAYGSLPAAPSAYSAFVRQTGPTTFSAVGVDDLCFGPSGNLYTWQSFTTAIPHGIYQVPPPDVNGRSLLAPVWSDPNGAYEFKGLAYNPANGLFYGSHDPIGTPAGTAARAIYTVDALGTGNVTMLAPLPTNPNASVTQRTEIDGLAIGGGKLWLSEKDRNSQNIFIYSYDLSTNAYDSQILTIPYADSSALATGLTWISGSVVPEPASLTVFAGGLVCLLRLRRDRGK